MTNKWREPPSPEFLEELRERARRYGWTGDWFEVRRFVEDLHRDAGVEFPEECKKYIEDDE